MDVQKLLVESYEADYLIQTTEKYAGSQRPQIIKNQLDDLELRQGHDYFIIAEKSTGDLESKNHHEDDEFIVYFCIKFTGNRIDNIAHRLGVKADLDAANIQHQFNENIEKEYVCFDARQRYTCIQKYLEQEIDFEHFVAVGIIDEHYPLHRTKAHEDCRESVHKYLFKIMKSFMLRGKWTKYMEPKWSPSTW